MSDPDPQKCTWFDGTLLCAKTFWGDLFGSKKENQLKVDSKGKSIESRFKRIESNMISIEIISYQEIS